MICEELLAAAYAADIQAGGGGSFGGGGGGGSGGGGGDGIGYVLYWLIRLAIEYPPLGVPLLIGAIIVFVMGSRRGWWKHQERTIRRASPKRRAQSSAKYAQILRQHDPDFDGGRFLVRTRKAFDKAQASWCAHDLEPLRNFVSDGVFERFSLQIEEQKKDGWRQGMKGTEVLPPTIVHAEVAKHFEVVTVRIPFRSDIHRVSLETGEKIKGSKIPRTNFVEMWTFVRRRGTKTIAGEGLIEGKCPNCSADLAMNQSARCSYCDCLARNGRFDWVLSEITQESAWSPESEARVAGFALYAERDPGMNVQMLEDRASVAFWRVAAAERAADSTPLIRLATPALAEGYGERFAPTQDGTRTYTAERAVGSVRTLGILAGEEADRAVVEVVWDGLRATMEGKKRKLEKKRYMRRSLFVFTRKAGETTQLDDAFVTTFCRNCGAHDTGGTDPTCSFCGQPRTGGRSEWLLNEILMPVDAAALMAELHALRTTGVTDVTPKAPVSKHTVMPETVSVPRAGVIAWAAKLVRADGVVDDKERAAMHSLGERVSLTSDQVDELIERRLDTDVPQPEDQREAYAWLANLIELALADGVLSGRERKFLTHAAQELGLPKGELDRLVRWTRKELYRESRAAKKFA